MKAFFLICYELLLFNPVLRKYEENKIADYRSIAVPSGFLSVFEKAFYVRLLDFLDIKNF